MPTCTIMKSLGRSPAKSPAERQKKFREKQVMTGSKTVTAYLDGETVGLLNDIVRASGRRDGGKSAAIKAAIRHHHKVICNDASAFKKQSKRKRSVKP